MKQISLQCPKCGTYNIFDVDLKAGLVTTGPEHCQCCGREWTENDFIVAVMQAVGSSDVYKPENN